MSDADSWAARPKDAQPCAKDGKEADMAAVAGSKGVILPRPTRKK